MAVRRAATALSTLVLIALVIWRTAQTTAIVRRSIDRVAFAQQMAPIRSGPVHAAHLAVALRTYKPPYGAHLRLDDRRRRTGTFMLRQASISVGVIGKPGNALNGPSIRRISIRPANRRAPTRYLLRRL